MSLHASPVTAAVTGDAPTLEQRIATIEALEAIRSLKAHYAALADQKYTPQYSKVPPAEMQRVARQQAECFTVDAVWDGGKDFGATLIGRDALTQWFNRSPWCFAVHFYGSPQIEVHGEKASGQWRLWQMALRDDTHEAVLLAGVTTEEYALQSDGRWLQSRMRFDQIHMLPVSDIPYPLSFSFATKPQLEVPRV
ncbi:hypothetical protein BH09PSE5_BH09PSE5_20440 [soil metagenome]